MTIHPTPVAHDMLEDDARRMYQGYLDGTHSLGDVSLDAEIKAAYRLIAQGKQLIDVHATIRAAGLNSERLPVLALTRATERAAFAEVGDDGSGHMRFRENTRNAKAQRIDFKPGFWPVRAGGGWQPAKHGRALRPPIPQALRPKRGAYNYCVLWEAQWEPLPPEDPLLVRRIGKSNMWLVCAAWDLTEIERGALAPRIAEQG